MLLPETVRKALEMLSEAGFEAYVVGGAVRDFLRGLLPHDFDLCTSARPEETKKVFSGFVTIDTGIRHGTVTVLLGDSALEITTFRIERGYHDYRRPDSVTFVKSVTNDLARRDFTINAMAYCPQHGLCDPFGGQEDLKTGIIRCVGDADTRFGEDALRILRGLRLAAETGFSFEPETEASLEKNCGLLAKIAAERIREELCRTVVAPYAGRILERYPAVIGSVIPEILPMVGFQQRNRHHLHDVWRHTVWATQFAPTTVVLRLAVLLHDIGKPGCFTFDDSGVGHFYGHPQAGAEIAHRILLRLKFDRETTERVTLLVLSHDEMLGETEKLIRRRLAKYGEDVFRQLLAIKKADCIGQGTEPGYLEQLLQTEAILNRILEDQQCFRLEDLAVNGHDMLAFGLRGKEIGAMLSKLLQMVVDAPDLNERDTLLKLCERQQRD